ncbi:MAG: radical SAM protein [Deltaproteobacteria bacterium]|nr:radical SAM protein [Deltaproteobacteria bacterium]
MRDIEHLEVHEIYESIQGESTFAGLPCAFVRLSRCNLRCRWCDTPQAFEGGHEMRRADVIDKALSFGTPLVEVTGGEPLLQAGAIPLLAELCDAGRTVLLETSGERDISEVDPRVHRIVDFKAPGSEESARNRWANVELLTKGDEVKLVLADRVDYEWAKQVIEEHRLADRVNTVLLSCVWGELDPKDLVRWVLEDRMPVRVQIQTHKVIWGADAEGV